MVVKSGYKQGFVKFQLNFVKNALNMGHFFIYRIKYYIFNNAVVYLKTKKK